MPTVLLPSPKAVRDLLAGLLGREVGVELCDAVVPDERDGATVAVYVDDSLAMSCLAVLDVALSAYVGAAIGLVPVRMAQACVSAGALTPTVAENLAEVLNVLSATLNRPGASHQRLYAVHEPGELPPSDVSAWAKVVVGRLDLAVSVAGYGTGRLGLVSCA